MATSVYAPRVEVHGQSSDYQLTVSAPYAVLKKKGDTITIPYGATVRIDTGLKLWFYIKSNKINNKDQPGHSSLLLIASGNDNISVTAVGFIRPNKKENIIIDVTNIAPHEYPLGSGDTVCNIAVVSAYNIIKLH